MSSSSAENNLVLLEFVTNGDWGNGEQQGGVGTDHEILIMAWAVYDVQLREVVHKNEILVRPTEAHELSAHCTSATGLTMASLHGASSLPAALKEFDDYLRETFTSNNKEFCLVTNGPWHVKFTLMAEARRKNISLEPYFYTVHDLRDEFVRCFPATKPPVCLARMIEDLELQVEGRRNYGLDAVISMTSVVSHLLEIGHTFSPPEKIPKDYNPDKDPAAQAAAKAAAEAAKAAADAQAEMIASTARQALEMRNGEAPPDSCILRLRGLPWQAVDDDVRAFFEGLRPVAIQFSSNYGGKPNGEAFVRFRTPQEATAGLAYDRRPIGKRYIEVFPAKDEDMQRAAQGGGPGSGTAAAAAAAPYIENVQRVNPMDPRYGGVIRMRGLPFRISESEIREFFGHQHEIATDGVTMCQGSDGRLNGEAYVEFTSEEIAKSAMSLHMTKIQNRYIELFRSSKGELFQYLQNRFSIGVSGSQREERPEDLGQSPFWVRMRGLPYNTTKMEILEFISRARVAPLNVHRVFSQAERFTGEAFIEFATEFEMHQAMCLNREHMGHRYVEMFVSSRDDAGAALRVTNLTPSVPQGYAAAYSAPYGAYNAYGAYGAGYGQAAAPAYDMYSPYNSSAPPPSSYDSQSAPPPPGGDAGGYYDPAANVPPPPPSRSNGGGGGGYNNAPPPPHGGGGDSGGYGHGVNIRMRGLPFRASTYDVLEFFQGYDILPDSIHIVQDGDGRPTGEAVMSFASPNEAARAAREKNRMHMGNRYVELFLN